MAKDEILGVGGAILSNLTSRILYAVYDLEIWPADMSAVNFLITASIYARKYDYAQIHLVLVPAKNATSDTPGDLSKIPDEWMMRHIVSPTASLMTIPTRSSIFSGRQDAFQFLEILPGDIYPIDYGSSDPSPGYTDSGPLGSIP